MTTHSAIRQLQLQTATRKRAAADPHIRRSAASLVVYLHLSNELDEGEFHAKKVDAIATELHLKIPTAVQALQRLVRAGYLERGAKIDRVWSYQLRWVDEIPTTKAG